MWPVLLALGHLMSFSFKCQVSLQYFLMNPSQSCLTVQDVKVAPYLPFQDIKQGRE